VIYYSERSGRHAFPSVPESDVLILACAAGIRVVEVLAALSLTTDLASGVAFEKGLRTCAVAAAFGRDLGLPPPLRGHGQAHRRLERRGHDPPQLLTTGPGGRWPCG